LAKGELRRRGLARSKKRRRGLARRRRRRIHYLGLWEHIAKI
jgi:hypothetical protein